MDILATRKTLNIATKLLDNLKSAKPLNAKTIVQQQETVDNLGRGMAYLKSLHKELFPKAEAVK